MKKTIIASIAVAALGLAACGDADPAPVNTADPAPVTRAAEEPTVVDETTEAVDDETTEAEPIEDVETTEAEGPGAPEGVVLDAPFAVADDVEMTITRAGTVEPGEFAFVEGEWDEFRAFGITLQNNSDEPINAMQSVYLQASTPTGESEPLFDGDFGGEPTADVMPGASTSWKVAFGADAGQPLTLQLSWDFDRVGYVEVPAS